MPGGGGKDQRHEILLRRFSHDVFPFGNRALPFARVSGPKFELASVSGAVVTCVTILGLTLHR